MSNVIAILVPAFLQEMALKLKLMLATVISMSRKDLFDETVSFVYETMDHKVEVVFDFKISNFHFDDKDVYKGVDIEGLSSVTIQTMYHDQELKLSGAQLKNITKRDATRIIKKSLASLKKASK